MPLSLPGCLQYPPVVLSPEGFPGLPRVVVLSCSVLPYLDIPLGRLMSCGRHLLVSQLPLLPVVFLSPSLRMPSVCFGLLGLWLLFPASRGTASMGKEYDGPLGASSPCPWLGVASWGSVRPGLAGLDSRVGIPLPRLAVLSRRRLDVLLPLFPVGYAAVWGAGGCGCGRLLYALRRLLGLGFIHFS